MAGYIRLHGTKGKLTLDGFGYSGIHLTAHLNGAMHGDPGQNIDDARAGPESGAVRGRVRLLLKLHPRQHYARAIGRRGPARRHAHDAALRVGGAQPAGLSGPTSAAFNGFERGRCSTGLLEARRLPYNRAMGRIRILSDQVANQIAAGEVVERPASVVKELLENSLDAGATRIRIEIEGGGRKLIRIIDNGHGMGQDDALLAFERHATSKLRTSDDLLSIATLGFRGEALPSIASVSRLDARDPRRWKTTPAPSSRSPAARSCASSPPACRTARPSPSPISSSTPRRGASSSSRSQTELSHIAALVTHYALAHPDKHIELHSATQALLVAPAVTTATTACTRSSAATLQTACSPPPPSGTAPRRAARAAAVEARGRLHAARAGLPAPHRLRLQARAAEAQSQLDLRLRQPAPHSRPRRMHALTEAYRNIIPPSSFPVVLLFLEMPPQEVDVNVHPAKTEVRFRQSSFLHDFIRDTVRTA